MADDVRRAVEDQRIRAVIYVVEATDDERHLLWRVHSEYSRIEGWGTGNVNWPSRSTSGWMVHVGEIGSMPVTVTVTFDTINGNPVLFWTSESQVVDWEMCRKWIAANVPAYEHAHCNAANFGHCLAAVSR